MTEEKNKIYVATFTTYTDDYKQRGRGWTDEHEPALFSTRQYAQEYLAELIRDNLKDYSGEYLIEKFPEHTNKDGEFIDLDTLDYSELSSILLEVRDGEFIEYTVDWDIEAQQLDTKRVKRRKIGEKKE